MQTKLFTILVSFLSLFCGDVNFVEFPVKPIVMPEILVQGTLPPEPFNPADPFKSVDSSVSLLNDLKLIKEVARQEGGGKRFPPHYLPNGKIITSSAGAVGIMGIMPGNFKQCGGKETVHTLIGNIQCGDLVLHKFRRLAEAKIKNKEKALHMALQWYNGGCRIGPATEKYATEIMKRLGFALE